MNQSKLTLGIFGGGQLAQMLIENSPFSDLDISIFTNELECPAKYTSGHLFKGSLKDPDSLRRFFSKVNFITFENEFVDVESLAQIKSEFDRVFILPTLQSIQITQNKLAQKYLFQKLGLPSSSFKAFDPKIDQPDQWLRSLILKPFQKISAQNSVIERRGNAADDAFSKGAFVLKRAMGGYDGKGNYVVKTLGELEKAIGFCQKALDEGTTVYAEEFVSFEKELAQVYTKSLNGDFISYPLVISEQEKNVCRLVYGPAVEFDVPKEIEEQTTAIGKKIANELKLIGTFAIEYFYKDGKILINEMAPRVHNSGHYTLDAAPINQFENHLHAILGSKLKSPSTYPYFAMRNILGPEGLDKNFDSKTKDSFTKTEDAKVYWYNKTKTSPYRKVGHINTIAMTKSDLLRKIKLMEEIEENFWEKLISKEV